MSIGLITPKGSRTRRRLLKDERSRLARQDAVAARLGELHHVRALLEEAIDRVQLGWIQHAWFAVLDAHGGERKLTFQDIHLAIGRPVSGVCLVGGIVSAGGGPAAVGSQLVQRTLDLTWHALHENPSAPVRWCPSPPVRAAHVRDLTRWNDRPRRTSAQVVDLLRAAVDTADAQIDLCRAQQSLLAQEHGVSASGRTRSGVGSSTA